MSRNTLMTVAALVLSTSAFAAPSDQEIRSFLNEFERNPKRVMNQLPKKKGARPRSAFAQKQIQTRDFIVGKDRLRKAQFPKAASGGRSGIEWNDQAKVLVDNPQTMLTNLSQMHRYRNASLAESPWSDDYWAIYTGQLGKRYTDPWFPNDWKSGFEEVIQVKTYRRLVELNGVSALNMISPAEKYDLLVGDPDFSFSHSNWEQGRYYYEQFGEVEPWMGLCHGWAAASYMLPRPLKAVELLAADGVTRLKFYPSDIKALATLLWSKVSYNARFAGGRCNDKEPTTDSNGRVLSQNCFDTNPGTFHITLVNQIGVVKRSFVMDATYDYEVWNQPVHAYSYTYFNPQTQRPGTLAESTVAISAFSADRFKRYRSPLAKSVVGVAIDVTYVVETHPTTDETDSPENDALTTVTYLYDLELDARNDIIGGEWYQNAHPDFLWTAEPEERLLTDYDRWARGSWDITRPIPPHWRSAAREASAQNLPLAKIVERLIFESRLQN